MGHDNILILVFISGVDLSHLFLVDPFRLLLRVGVSSVNELIDLVAPSQILIVGVFRLVILHSKSI